MYPDSLKDLIESFKLLPGIGEKNAERLSFAVLHFSEENANKFSNAIINVKTKIKKSKTFEATPFGLYSILIFEDFSYENKHKKIDDKWVEVDEKEPVLNAYDVLREGDVC